MDSLTGAIGISVAALDRLGVRYLLGGSVPSLVWGVPRATMGVDLLAAIGLSQAAGFAAALGPDWHAGPPAIGGAIQDGRAFNVIHIPSGQKFDIFPPTNDFHQSELTRATPVTFHVAGLSIRCPVATVEDILLAKLQRYRAGGEVSERQWTDVLGLVAMNRALDREYLAAWAGRLGVRDLLARAVDVNI